VVIASPKPCTALNQYGSRHRMVFRARGAAPSRDRRPCQHIQAIHYIPNDLFGHLDFGLHLNFEI
jgi:hypothetical protein